MVNGKIVSAAPEERFTRKKWTTDFPINSANWCLKNSKLSWSDLDLIAIPWNPGLNISSASSRWDSNISWRGEMLSNIPSNILKATKNYNPGVISLYFDKTKIVYLNHHDCHAASAVFVSPLKNVII